MDLDDLFRLGQDHYLYDSWKQFGVTEQIIQHLKLADVVTVTTDILANMVVEVNKNVVIVPNALPFDQDQFTMNERFDDTRLIYVAGTSHQKDFELMDFNSGLTVAGLHIDNLPTKEVMPAVRYMSLYDGHQAALAPLVDTEFNRCKSNLKLLEAGAKGLPLFASKIPPYLNSNDASIIQYVEYGKSWKAMTQRYSNEHLADIGAMTAQHVRKHYHLKDANAVRRQIFESFS